jgi:hypothetical protein
MMPASAIANVTVDRVVALSEIGPLLVEMCMGRTNRRAKARPSPNGQADLHRSTDAPDDRHRRNGGQ